MNLSDSTIRSARMARLWALRSWSGPLVVGLVGAAMAALGFYNLQRPDQDNPVPLWPLVAAVVGVLMIIAVLVATGSTRYRAHWQTRDHLRALELLQQVSAAISARIGQGPAVLQQVTDAARNLLHMSMACIFLLDADNHVTAKTASGVDEPIVGLRWRLEDLRAIRRALEENRPIWISNADKHEHRIHPDALHRYGMRAFLVVPLEVEGRTLGALVIADRRPRYLREDQMRLAHLWGAHAAVILHNDGLYQRMESALQHERQVQAHRDLLVDLSIALYERQSLQVALQRLSERAPSVLGVDQVSFANYYESGEFEFIALTSGTGGAKWIGKRFAPGTLRGGDSLRLGRIISIEDAAEARLHPELLKSMRIGSIMFIPLFGSDGTPLAVMSLMRHRTGPFTLQQQQTATNLADRIAAAIEGVRLHDRIRNDAETKSMLLRELHHRVKNNLAGIVSLLSMNQPELPQPARQWLNRVIDRIGIMARTHEMFTGASESLSLNEVFRITLSSLSVVVPSSMRIQTDVTAGERSLSPDRAVALAMVLHELAHNAIAHGAGPNGTLTLRCLATREQVRIEVIDDGKAREHRRNDPPRPPLPGADRATSGTGLVLVRGLVSHELQGVFTIEQNNLGGTTAAVAFSAKQCDADQSSTAISRAEGG